MDQNKEINSWILCLLIIIITIYVQIDISNLIFRSTLQENSDVIHFMKMVTHVSQSLGTIFTWIFFTIALHTISILIDVNIKDNLAKLFRITGHGFIFVLIVLIINRVKINSYIDSVYFSEKVITTENFREIIHYDQNRLRIFFGYLLFFLWSIVFLKKVYKHSLLDTILVSSIVCFIIMTLWLIKIYLL